ncbi:ATP-dependent dethiobiotin synthetase BioD [archaeon MnTg01]|nr:ATP-dependent dethiobiotin synthetase BioD [archaeon MnTg01]
MNSFFITGTDTDVGKTYVTAGIAAALKKQGKDVGIMKPFAAGTPQNTGYKSEDVQILSKAAQVNDPEKLVNPYFFLIPASPFTAAKNFGIKIDIKMVLSCFKQLSSLHEILLVEGIGGAMTPILQNYFVTNLIKDMNLETIIVTSSKIGTVNHTLMTCKICQYYKIKIRGIIINNLNLNGYSMDVLTRDLEELTKIEVIGSIPYFEKFNLEQLSKTIINEFDSLFQ